ncbi:glycosyltransferase [Marivita hallyeonensis]|uniref:Glycosyltransferase, catalytic subunit of cellulose synthase and poly-beta-1,6-N-acetylglucosamine synthase n=1 Tax=Marivita hallyeonensis TaxID=996342 RepID=A0A1M5W9R2_9RHOB|nr:glycosyltransferase [Marivita hallyeonensis]SHH83924.1 Glycosyltransferase, catalytic subunit of cellulose synthase and poly-beta-1,6-N-acetylglucosamine synthase [Marivita hallyeonensis]
MVLSAPEKSASPFVMKPSDRFATEPRETVSREDRVIDRATALASARRQLDPVDHPPTRDLDHALSPEFCLENLVLPWDKVGSATLVATAHRDFPGQLRHVVEDAIGPIVFAYLPEAELQNAISDVFGEDLVEHAESRVDKDLSCRDINKMTLRRAIAASLFFGVSLALIFLFPRAFFIGITTVAITNVVACSLFKVVMLFVGYRKPIKNPQAIPLDEHPVVSIMVPMYREERIANELIARLNRLTYPKALMDVVLIVEKFDKHTKRMIEDQSLPSWMRMIEVPDGRIRTKPRALNYAFKFTRGDIVGILDAEDAPATDQIERVVEAFHAAPKEVACVQGILDFYNTRSNWIARCFTIEYATWFRVILAGAARIGLQIPLGGTTVYLRRHALQEVGAWDAHNVTEDADLGVRLARFGYQTILLPTVTREEANNRMIPWIKQRSRWLKGYMITYIVHMRRPFRHWREVGTKKFVGFQLFFLTSILQFTLAPALWSFWLVFFGLSTPFMDVFPSDWMKGLLALFLMTELISLMIGFAAVARTQHEKLMQWVPMMMFYHPMGVFAAYKALAELVMNPFYWDKTKHGMSSPDTPGGDIHSSVN